MPTLPPVATGAPQSFYADGGFPLFELQMDAAEWADICTKAKDYADYLEQDDRPDFFRQEYTRVDLTLQNVSYPGVGVRFRGRSTIQTLFYDHHEPIPGALDDCIAHPLVKKPSLKTSLDEFEGDAAIAGQQTFNLIAREGNDSQYLLEVLAQKVTNPWCPKTRPGFASVDQGSLVSCWFLALSVDDGDAGDDDAGGDLAEFDYSGPFAADGGFSQDGAGENLPVSAVVNAFR